MDLCTLHVTPDCGLVSFKFRKQSVKQVQVALNGAKSDQKAPQGSETKTRELLVGTEATYPP